MKKMTQKYLAGVGGVAKCAFLGWVSSSSSSSCKGWSNEKKAKWHIMVHHIADIGSRF